MSSMRLDFTARHFTLTPRLRALAEQRLERALRPLNDGAVSAQIVLTKEQSRFRVEVTLHVRGEHFLHAEATGHDAEAAVAAAADKLERQTQRLKGRWTQKRRRAVSTAKAAALPSGARVGRGSSAGPRREDERRTRVVRARRYAVKPMSVEEAAMVLGDGDNAFLVFRNAATDSVNVLFRRPDGRVGLIEPEG